MRKKFKRVPWRSKITKVERDSLVTHGLDQREIIRDFSYEEMVFFVLSGRKPTHCEADLLRALLVAHVSHGITGQSTLAVMEAADCRSGFLHALIGGFSVGAGSYHQGGLHAAMNELENLASLSDEDLDQHLQKRIASGEKIFGFGHRFHRNDPRVDALLERVSIHKAYGKHVKIALRATDVLKAKKNLNMNIEMIGAAILLDLGIDSKVAHLFIILGRGPMFAAAYLERLGLERPPFQRVEICDLIESDD